MVSLSKRWIGAELSMIEKELACNKIYENIGFVKYDTPDGCYFYLHPSPFLPTAKHEIYYAPVSPPPENQFVEVEVCDIIPQFLDKSRKKFVYIKKISSWKPFDPTTLAAKRKILDFREIIDFFTYPYKGESDIVQEIAVCSALFSFSSPPIRYNIGGIKSAIFGKQYQWDLFQRPLKIIPKDFMKITSDYYYYSVSEMYRCIRKSTGEVNQAILKPEKMISDIPIVIEDMSQRKFLKGDGENYDTTSNIVTSYLLDALLLRPKSSETIEKMMHDAVYELRDEYFSAGQRPFNQNIGDAIPKLASSYARLQASSDIRTEDVKYIVDLWSSMFRRAEKISSYPMKISHIYELTADARRFYFECYDVFGADYNIPLAEAMEALNVDPIDFELAIDSLVEKGYCKRSRNSIMLLEPYK